VPVNCTQSKYDPSTQSLVSCIFLTDPQFYKVKLLPVFIMVGPARSLGPLYYLTLMALATISAPAGANSIDDPSWVEDVLNSPNLSLPDSSTTLGSKSNTSAFINAPNRGVIRCFANPPPPAPTRHPSIMTNDYLDALEEIVVENDALNMVSWVFMPNERKTWSSNECRIAVWAPSYVQRTVSGIFQPVVVSHLAAKIAQECFKPDRILGGYVTFGEHQELTVVLGATRSNLVGTATS
jgi:hypothetical protein